MTKLMQYHLDKLTDDLIFQTTRMELPGFDKEVFYVSARLIGIVHRIITEAGEDDSMFEYLLEVEAEKREKKLLDTE